MDMYAARQNKEKISRRIDSTGSSEARQKIKVINKMNVYGNSIQKMSLKPKGAFVAQLGPVKRIIHGLNLLNNTNINLYTNGICYEAVAYTRYLLGANIPPNNLVNTNGQNWLAFFNFNAGQQWFGGNIPQGMAVGFQTFPNGSFFHAAISLGGTTVRGVNGHLLGTGWTNAGDRDLATIPYLNGRFTNPNGGGYMNIWISNL